MTGWRRTFWVISASNLIAGAGLMSFLPFFPTLLEGLGMQDLHARAVWSGVLFGAAPLSAAFSGPMWGSIGDRHGRKIMVVRALCGLALFVGAMTWARTAWELLFLRLGQGVLSGYMAPSLTLVSVVAPREMQGRVTSWLQTASTIGTILGPMLGALVLGHLGVRSVFAVVAGAALVSALLVALFAREAHEARSTNPPPVSIVSLLAAARDDLRRLLQVPKLREALILYAAVQFALGATNPLMEFLVEATWTGDHARIEELTGTLFSALALSAIVATPLWGRWADRIGPAPVLRVSSALSALALAAHALAPAYGWLLAVRIVFGLASPGASASAFSLAATETESGSRGAAMGTVFSARSFAVSGGSFVAGSVAAALGIRGLFAAAGAVIAVGLLLGRRASAVRAVVP